jgi:hypothetical protein
MIKSLAQAVKAAKEEEKSLGALLEKHTKAVEETRGKLHDLMQTQETIRTDLRNIKKHSSDLAAEITAAQKVLVCTFAFFPCRTLLRLADAPLASSRRF